MSETTEYNVRAVERALQILKSFDDKHPERGVSEIAESVGLHKATTHRILATLLNFGFVERTMDGLKYRLGVQLVDLGFKVSRRMDLRREAMPFITKLALQINEAVDLSIWNQSTVLYIEMIQSQHALTVSATPGQRLPAYCTASGKVFLSHLSEEELNQSLAIPLHPSTKNTITSINALKSELAQVRKQGYALDNEEYEYGVRAVAAPVLNLQNQVIGSVSVPGPANRLTEEHIQEIIPQLLATTMEISRCMGWSKTREQGH
jgi:IclR family transcriptional regulator, KDG regulon repressor